MEGIRALDMLTSAIKSMVTGRLQPHWRWKISKYCSNLCHFLSDLLFFPCRTLPFRHCLFETAERAQVPET